MMTNMNRFGAAVLALLVSAACIQAADLKLNRYFSDDMVIQRNKPVTIKGTADKGATVTVEFADQKKEAKADNDGQWRVTLDPMPANSKGQELKLHGAGGRGQVSIKNVVVGDVFLHARQTSIDISLGRDEEGKKAASSHKKDPMFRAITIKAIPSDLTFDRAKTPWIKMLNGDWKFHWSENPASRPVDFYKPDFDDDEWSTIPVPSNWQLHGHGTPIYTNIKYPFPGRPPGAPREYNPVGSYRSSFILPKDWSGRKTYIHFAGVSSAFYLWVNGEKVGYSEGSRTPAEFDITAYLKPGENHLAAESLPPLQVQDADEIIVSSPNLELRFDKSQALLSSMTYKEQAMIARGFTPDFWRALTDNDRPSVKKFADKEWAYTQLEEISAQVKTPVMVADHMLLIQIENWKG